MIRREPRILANTLAIYWLRSYAGVMLLVAFLLNLATGFVQYGYSLTLPPMEDALHISHTQAGLLITVTAATRMGGSLASGTLAPRYGSRTITAVGTLGVGIGMVLLGFSQNYAAAVGAAVLMGVASGAALTPIMGLLAAWFQARDRGLAAGLAASGGSITFIFAGLIIPFLTAANWEDGWRHSWQLFGGIVIVVGVLLSPVRSGATPGDQRVGAPTRPSPHRLAGGGVQAPGRMADHAIGIYLGLVSEPVHHILRPVPDPGK